MKELLQEAERRAEAYRAAIPKRRVAPTPEDVARLEHLAQPLPNDPTDPLEVLRVLDDFGSPATVASSGGRYFGFVTGGSLPAALAANWLAAAWDQNCAFRVMSPVASRLEEIAADWLRDLFGLPQQAGVGFVTGATMASFAGLTAARHALLARAGWNVEDQGLFGAPELKVIVGAEVHISLLKALSLVGLGKARVTTVPADGQGRLRVDQLPSFDERTIVCIQAGNVNTGAFDPAAAICPRAREAGAWVHVDGAFGLWAAAAPSRAQLAKGVEQADSLATDCHKWLNVPYACGLAFVRDPAHLRNAMTFNAAYLQTTAAREPWQFTPEASRRARGVEVWAALHSLGRTGLAEMIERHCRQAARFADKLRAAGFSILNEVVLNQVLVSFGTPEQTRRIIEEIQRDGTCWCGGTQWQGHTAMRISVSSWATTDEDVERSLDAMVRIARGVLAGM
ncbi:MAG TPA: aminotransferase class V-fold PLP-dependent enzyme [Terriglobales bacterium]|nr:aminotransferase class V-fold PLP-dependent enzyme [Terriglobales bacterium]